MQGEFGGTIVADTDLDGAVATTDTEIDVTDASNLDSSGAFVIYDDEMPDIIEHTGKSSNQVTGVTGIGFAHEDADKVSKLYALPSDFNDLRPQNEYGDGLLVANVIYSYTSGTPISSQFSIYDNGTTQYLWLPRDSSGDFSLLYNKTSTTIDQTTDTVNIPDREIHNQWFLVYRICEYCAPLLELDPQLFKNKADSILSSELRKRMGAKRPRLLRSAEQLNNAGGSRRAGYNTKAGFRGYYG